MLFSAATWTTIVLRELFLQSSYLCQIFSICKFSSPTPWICWFHVEPKQSEFIYISAFPRPFSSRFSNVDFLKLSGLWECRYWILCSVCSDFSVRLLNYNNLSQGLPTVSNISNKLTVMWVNRPIDVLKKSSCWAQFLFMFKWANLSIVTCQRIPVY